jgi:nicotinate-nucleotide pyrophosphorylase (carboxylating)
MLDNMTPDQARTCVQIVHGLPGGDSVLIEASGGINLDNVAFYADAGVDLISVGALTHSAPELDIGLDVSGVTR